IPATCRERQRSNISSFATGSSSATVPAASNAAASSPSSWATTATATPDTCRWSTTLSGSPSRLGLHNTAATSSGSATATAAAKKSTAAASYRACTTYVRSSRKPTDLTTNLRKDHTMTNTATKTYYVGVIERAIAYYEVEAEDARAAAENWQDG